MFHRERARPGGRSVLWVAAWLLMAGGAMAQPAPPSGEVPQPAPEAEVAQPDAATEANTEPVPEAAPAADTDGDTGTDADTDTDTDAGTDTGTDTDTETGTGTDAGTDSEDDDWGEGDGWGEGDDWGGDDDVGFAESPDAPPPPPLDERVDEERAWELTGFLRTREALWVERLDGNPFAQARQSLDLEGRYKTSFGATELRLMGQIHFEYDLAYLHERDSYDDATLDAYQWQIIGGETFVALSHGPVELTVGRQIVAWGQGEMFSPVDVVNPRDMREPGLAELDDVRMAVLASRLGLFFGAHRIEAMVVHESFFGLRPAPLSDFSPLSSQITGDPLVASLFDDGALEYRDVPGRFDTDASQLLGRWSYAGHGIDLALYAANVLDQRGMASLPGPADADANPIPLRIYHPRYTMIGHAGALPEGDFVLRWELSSDLDRPLMTTDPSAPAFNISMTRRTQLNWLAGLTYAGITDGSLGLEYQQALVLDAPDGGERELLSPVEDPAFGLRYSHNFLRETLQLIVAGSAFGLGDFRGFFARAEISYELQDALKVGLGYATFQPHGDEFGPLTGFDTHDRVFTTLRWDFAL